MAPSTWKNDALWQTEDLTIGDGERVTCSCREGGEVDVSGMTAIGASELGVLNLRIAGCFAPRT